MSVACFQPVCRPSLAYCSESNCPTENCCERDQGATGAEPAEQNRADLDRAWAISTWR